VADSGDGLNSKLRLAFLPAAAKNDHMLQRAFLLFAIVLAPMIARADFVIQQKSESRTAGVTSSEDTTTRIKGHKARVDRVITELSATGTNTSVFSRIMDLDTFDTYAWMSKQKKMIKFSGALVAQMAAATTAQLAGKVRPPPPQDSGKTGMVGGYQTEIYNWTNITGVSMKLWVARNFPNYKEITTQLDRLSGPPVTRGLTSLDFSRLPGMVMKVDRFRGGTNLSSYTLISAKEEPVDTSALVIPTNYPIRDLQKETDQAAKIQSTLKAGTPFPGFSEKGVDGKPLSLADYKGKVVLIDFWATWCPPCRAEIPNVVAAYKKYHSQGFEVIGVSLDQDQDQLLSYTKGHDMAWRQFFDGQGWQNKLAVRYGIQSIPATYLLDTNGIILASDVRGEALNQALTRALPKK
jgi:peroxiredoxin